MSALAKYRAHKGEKPAKPMKRVATVAVMHGSHLLMGKRRDNSKWTTPGGHLEAGEDFAAGAARELEEESGITAKDGALKPLAEPKTVTKPDGEKLQVQPYLYLVKDRPETSMKDDPDAEVHRWKWIDVSGGLPADIAKALHVPLKDNVLTEALGLAGDGDNGMKHCGANLGKYLQKKGMTVKDIDESHSKTLEDPSKSMPPDDEEGEHVPDADNGARYGAKAMKNAKKMEMK